MADPDIDPAWFQEKTRPAARDWCPRCEPDVDPLAECVVPYLCANHREESMAGLDDSKVRRPFVCPVIEGTEIANLGGW